MGQSGTHRPLKIGKRSVCRCDETSCDMLNRKGVSLFSSFASQWKVLIMWGMFKVPRKEKKSLDRQLGILGRWALGSSLGSIIYQLCLISFHLSFLLSK